MRLFFAINFSDSEKELILQNINMLKSRCSGGSFTRRENLHLTLEFIGEVDRARLGAVRAAAAAVRCAPPDFTLCGAGRFSDIVWLGTDDTGAQGLRRLSSALRAESRARGIAFDEKPFSPHITISRRTEFYGNCGIEEFSKAVKPVKISVSSFELMESSRINGILTYTKIYSEKLNPEEK